jgi:two-component system, cell cycle sensor histidine kinase and response regulator CckA
MTEPRPPPAGLEDGGEDPDYPAGLYEATPEGRLLRANAALVAMLGYTSLADTLAHARIPVGPRPGSVGEVQLARANGTPFWALRSERTRGDGERLRHVGVLVEVTEMRGEFEATKRDQKMEAIGRLAGGIAHDFNNLLAVILNYASIVMEELPEQDPIRQDVDEIHRAAQRAANLTRQLLVLSRKEIVNPAPLDLNELMTDIARSLRKVLGDDVELVTALAPKLRSVKLDAAQFEQLFVALATNAREAMPNGGKVTLQTRSVDLRDGESALGAGVYAAIVFEDTGRGMDELVLTRAFEPFFTTKPKGKGPGLGLATVYGIVKQAGGDVTLRSTLGQGTTVTIVLPTTHDVPGARTAGPSRAVSRQTLRGRGEVVLVTEDEDAVRALACRILSKNGYTVLEARGPSEALRLCETRTGPIDLLLTDVVMPQMSGTELAKRVLELRPPVRVLFMSGYAGEVLAQHGREPLFELVQKPFTEEGLLARVRATLEEAAGARPGIDE